MINTTRFQPPELLRQCDRRHAYAALCLLATIIDIADTDSPYHDTATTLDLVILLLCYKLPRYPRAIGAALAIILSIELANPTFSSIATFACFSMLTEWSARGWLRSSCSIVAAAAILTGVSTPNNSFYEISGILMVSATAIAIGLTLRSHHQTLQAHALREELLQEQAANARQATSAAIALTLHDTCATTLSEALVKLRLLQGHARGTDLEDQASDAVVKTQTALVQLRQIINTTRSLSATQDATSPALPDLPGEIQGAQDMLASREITLTISGDDPRTWNQHLPEDRHSLACLTVREGTINILKFAPRGSRASLELSVSNALHRLTLRSQLSTPATSHPRDEAGLSGGFGLAGLTMRASQLGSSVAAGAWGDEWRLVLVLPHESEDS